MKEIKVKELLELLAPVMINRKKAYFQKKLSDVVSISEQTQWVEQYGNNVKFDYNRYIISSFPGDVKKIPVHNFLLLYDFPTVDENLVEIEDLIYYIEGFNTYQELKARIEDGIFSAGRFFIFIKNYEGYKNVPYHAEFNDDWDNWIEFSIPCLGEIYDVETVYNGDERSKVTDEYYAGIFSSHYDVENFIQETRIFDKMEKKQAFETNGKFKYEDRNFTFKIEYDDIVATLSTTEHDKDGNHILLQYCKDEKEAARLREM